MGNFRILPAYLRHTSPAYFERNRRMKLTATVKNKERCSIRIFPADILFSWMILHLSVYNHAEASDRIRDPKSRSLSLDTGMGWGGGLSLRPWIWPLTSAIDFSAKHI